jgi:hypothetical protein
MKRMLVVTALATSLAAGSFTTGCANMSNSQQRALSGGAAGAAAGAALGAITGNPGTGAAIGGAAGAAGGYLYEKSRDRDRHDRDFWYR